MNNKEFTTELARRLGATTKETTSMMNSLLADMIEQWEEGNVVSIQGFGTFEVKKKGERVSVNPTSKLRLLIPPKLALTFKPHASLKGKFK